MEQKALFNVKYWSEAYDFLSRIDKKTSAKILENIEKARYGLDPKLLKKLTGEIWEFRTLYATKQYRLFAFWDKQESSNTLVIATHGFVKKTQKTPSKEINKALQIRNKYYNIK